MIASRRPAWILNPLTWFAAAWLMVVAAALMFPQAGADFDESNAGLDASNPATRTITRDQGSETK